MRFIIRSLYILILIKVSSPLILPQLCDDVKINMPINHTYIPGKWYQSDSYGLDEICGWNEVTKMPDSPSKYKIVHTFGEKQEKTSYEILINDNNITLDFNGKILGIDANFGIIWSCKQLNETTSDQILIIISRNRKKSMEDYPVIKNLLEKYKIYTDELKRVSQHCSNGTKLTFNMIGIILIMAWKIIV